MLFNKLVSHVTTFSNRSRSSSGDEADEVDLTLDDGSVKKEDSVADQEFDIDSAGGGGEGGSPLPLRSSQPPDSPRFSRGISLPRLGFVAVDRSVSHLEAMRGPLRDANSTLNTVRSFAESRTIRTPGGKVAPLSVTL